MTNKFRRMIATAFVTVFAVSSLNVFAIETSSTETSLSDVSVTSDTASSSASASNAPPVSSSSSSSSENTSDSSSAGSEASSSSSANSSSEPDKEIDASSENTDSNSSQINSFAAPAPKTAVAPATVNYQVHSENVGWLSSVSNGAMGGTEGRGLRMESVKISVSSSISGGVQYRTFVENIGWMDWNSNGALSGTEGRGLRMEALQIKLTGELANQYDIYYSLHVQDIGWMGWAKNGESAGTSDYAKRIEAIKIQLVAKGGSAPGSTKTPYRQPAPIVSYKTNIQGSWTAVSSSNGASSGIAGSSKRMEAVKATVYEEYVSGGIEYRAFVQNVGWMDWASNGAVSGTVGKSLRMEAVQFQLTGWLSAQFDVYYRVYVQGAGWLGWAKNGASAGSMDYSKSIDSIEIKLVEKGGAAPGSTSGAFWSSPKVTYQPYVQSKGWTSAASDGASAGTTGQGLQMEGIKIKVSSGPSAGIQYRTHVQNVGWTDWVADNAASGSSGKGLRMESIEMKLTGDLAKQFDIYYRVHVENIGWMGWAKNGASAGTANYGLRVEAIQIKLVYKDGSAPGSTSGAYKEPSGSVSYQSHYQDLGWIKSVTNGALSGSAGSGKRLEAIKITTSDSYFSSSIQYRSFVQNIGWMGWVSNGGVSGTTSEGYRTEAIQIKLTGDFSKLYDIYYRVYVEGFGWMGWAKNGASAGTSDYSKRIESIQIQLVKSGGAAPGSTDNAYKEPPVTADPVITYSGATTLDGISAIDPGQSATISVGPAPSGSQYRFRLENSSGSVQEIRGYGNSSSISWKSSVAGRYKIYADVKYPDGKVKTATKYLCVAYTGIDVSTWNGTLNTASWSQFKANGIDFVMIRAGFGKENINNQTDNQLANNIKGAKAVGMPIGLYHYSYAKSVAEAKQEANFLLQILQANNIKPSDLAYPIAFDLEEKDRFNTAKRQENTDMVNAFCSIIQQAGYMPMLYASSSLIKDYLYYDQLKDNNIWMAAWGIENITGSSVFNGHDVDIWQYSDVGKLNGFSGYFDLNLCFNTNFSSGSSTNPSVQQGRVNIDSGVLNVRSGPGTSYGTLGSLNKNELVTILETSGGWYKIKTSSSLTGYASAEFITKI